MMNHCMRTGLAFAIVYDRLVTRTGDLFLIDGDLQIRGVPRGSIDRQPDVIVDHVDWWDRKHGSPYMDTEPGVVILECTDQFRDFVAEWSPAMLGLLPVKETA